MSKPNRIEGLNYHHLLYFWTVAREGSMRGAARRLGIAQPTVTTQIKSLERWFGTPLFRRAGGELALTDAGHVALQHADEIFAAGRALVDAVRGRESAQLDRLAVGVSDVLPKTVAVRLLEPTLGLTTNGRLQVIEDRTERLLLELAMHGLDLVLTDAPVGPNIPVRAYNHLLGECGVRVMATPALAARHARRFPASLDGAPLLLPAAGAALRAPLTRWLESEGLRPRVVVECQDGAMLKAFAAVGAGLVVVPALAVDQVEERYGLRTVGEIPEVRERFYAVSLERRIRQPAVAVITEAARQLLLPYGGEAA